MNNLQEHGWDLSDVKHIDLSSVEARTYRLDHGDVLFNRTNSKELVGKCAVFQERGDWVFASYLIRVKLDAERLLPEFLAYFLNGRAGRVQIDRLSRQIIGMANINAEEIRSLLVAVPPLGVQRTLLTKVQESYEARHQKLAEADASLDVDTYLLRKLGLVKPREDERRVFATRLGQIRSEKRLNADYFHPERVIAIREQEGSEGLRIRRLADIADFVREKVIAPPTQKYVGLANIQSHTGEMVVTDHEEVKGTAFCFAKDDILFPRLRPYLNKVYYAESDGVCSTEFHVIRIRPVSNSEEEIVPAYLAAVLRSSLVLVQTRHMMTGNTLPRLASEEVVNLVVPVPDLGIQQSIAAEIVRRRREARRLRNDAEVGWTVAQERFYEELFGGSFTL